VGRLAISRGRPSRPNRVHACLLMIATIRPSTETARAERSAPILACCRATVAVAAQRCYAPRPARHSGVARERTIRGSQPPARSRRAQLRASSAITPNN